MKLAFTTLGCPRWDMDTIIDRAVEYGFDGVDFRGYRGEMKLHELPEFTTDGPATARRFADAGLEVPCLSSSVRALSAGPEALAAAIDELRRYAELCQHFGARYVRIFGGALGERSREAAIDGMAAELQEMLAAIADTPVEVLIETHGEWTDSRHLAAVVQQVDSDALGILWDTHHPYRTNGETPDETMRAIGPWIRNTHWKDSREQPEAEGGHRLCLVGEGDVPLAEMLASLEGIGYDGYLTLEWEKHWHPEIDEPEVAFPGYVAHMRELMGSLQRHPR